MNRHTLRSVRLSAVACALGLAFAANNAAAQSSEVAAATVKACAVSGSVTVTVLGLNTTLPLPCTAQAQRTAAGSDEKSALGIDVGLLGLVNVIKLDTVHQRADYTNLTGATALDGFSEAAGLSLVQNLVTAQGLRGSLACDSLSGNSTLQCQATSTIADVRVAGGNVITLPSPLPRDFTVPVGGSLRLTVLGLPIEVPVGGALTLNHATALGAGTRNVTVLHQPAALTLGGSVSVGGLGLVGVRVEAVASPSTITVNATRPVTAVTID
ncbi:hypothetical protein [Pseudomonas sp. CGJS7]|uniref:hypothetical protein n=1 Tax=Pseudomonas sp. CGJS7 TaxID=3109348 RepID=UPI003009979C